MTLTADARPFNVTMSKNARQWLLLFAAWLVVSCILAGLTFAVCGSFQPLYYDSCAGRDYGVIQRLLFFITWLYSWPVDSLFVLVGRVMPFDVFASPFLLEIADLKLGPLVGVLYALTYSGVSHGVVRVYRRLRPSE